MLLSSVRARCAVVAAACSLVGATALLPAAGAARPGDDVRRVRPAVPAQGVASGTSAAPVRARPAPVGERVGVADANLLWMDAASQAAALDAIAAAGFRWVRVDYPWSAIQHLGPDWWDWSATDRFTRAATTRGLKVLAVVSHSPVWARTPGTAPHSAPIELDGFVRFAREVARRYVPMGVRHFEIWNEPNLRMFWGRAPDAAEYADMLIRTAAAIREVAPRAFILSAGLGPALDVPEQTVSPLAFLVGMYLAGAGPSFDALAMHPYSFPFHPTTPEVWNTFWIQRYTRIVMGWFGDSGKRIWATEFGFATGTSPQAVSDETQAAFTADGVRAWRAYPLDGPIFVYTWRDHSNDPSVWDHNMGLVRVDGSPKPIMATMTALNRTRAP